MKDGKPWYRSLTVGGVIAGVVGFLSSPEVFGLLPPVYAKAVGVLGAAAAVLGLRRSVPPVLLSPPSTTPTDHRQWEFTFDAAGFNPYGETMEQVMARNESMIQAAHRANLDTIAGPQGSRRHPPGAAGPLSP